MRGSYWCKLNFYATMETRAFQRCFFQKVSDREVTQCSWSARHVGVCHRRFAWRWRGAFNISGILLQVSWQDDSIKRVFWFSFFLFQPTGQTDFAIRKNMKSPHTDVFVEDKHQPAPHIDYTVIWLTIWCQLQLQHLMDSEYWFLSHTPILELPKSIPSNSTKLCVCHNYLEIRMYVRIKAGFSTMSAVALQPMMLSPNVFTWKR